MTLDEAIEFCNEKSKNIKLRTEPKTFEQIAEWLEELKSIKDGSIPIIHGKAELELHDREIRNKAIDDFNEKLMEQQIYDCMLPDGFRTDIVTSHTIDAIAEQLKAGDGE